MQAILGSGAAAARIVIVGGGVMGAAIACFLARDFGRSCVVLERDPSYRRASSALSASSIRQQFSTPINIAASQSSFAFYRNIACELSIEGVAPAIGLTEAGYLYLATSAGIEALDLNHQVQRRGGARVARLDREQLRHRFPWLSVDDLAGGTLGLAGEGWFDGYSVLQAFRRKATSLGVQFVHADVGALRRRGDRVTVAETTDGRRFECDALVIAAGCWSSPLARQLGFDLPVRGRKRDVFVFDSPARLPDCPLLIDPSGLWFRPESRGFICGAPPRGSDADDLPLEDIDYGLFDEFIWPHLARRVPGFEALRLSGAWAGYYEYNTFDQNGIVGRVPDCDNAFIACGFSGHGMQHAPAIGRGMAELVALGRFETLDLTPLAPARIGAGRPLHERNVI